MRAPNRSTSRHALCVGLVSWVIGHGCGAGVEARPGAQHSSRPEPERAPACHAVEDAYLKSPHAEAVGLFGSSVAFDGDTLAISALGEHTPDADGDDDMYVGALYVFRCRGSAWVLEARLLPRYGSYATTRFGESIALDGDRLAVGAPGELAGEQGAAGAVHVYRRSGSTWTEEAVVTASNRMNGDQFGKSVALDGDTLAVGAVGEASLATGVGGDRTNDDGPTAGAAYVFRRHQSSWIEEAYIKASNTAARDFFGRAIALDGDRLAVGANDAGNPMAAPENQYDIPSSGSVHVYRREGTTWTEEAYLRASNADPRDEFGAALALDGEFLVVGAAGESSSAIGVGGDESDDGAEDSGAVYVFRRSGSTWSQDAYLKASNTGARDRFGVTVAIDGNQLVVGASGEGSRARGFDGDASNDDAAISGAVYLYRNDGTTWRFEHYIKAPNADPGDGFGYALAVAGSMLVVTATGEASGVVGELENNDLADSGAAYVIDLARISTSSSAER